MCSLVQCFNVFVQPKHQELRTIIDVCGYATFGCDGMCFDALFGMFRTLCSRSIIVRSFFTNTKHAVLFCQKKKHWTRAGEWESRIIGPFPWDACVVIPSRRVFEWEQNENGAKDLREVRRGRLEEGRQEKDHRESETEGTKERRRKRRRERPHYLAARTSLTTRDSSESFPVGCTRHLDAEPSQSDGFFKPVLMSVSCFFFEPVSANGLLISDPRQ